MKANYFKWVIASFLAGLMAVAPTAQAGLLGALVGDAIAHHEEEKAQQNGQSNMLTQHPVMGAVAGSVAGMGFGFRRRERIQSVEGNITGHCTRTNITVMYIKHLLTPWQATPTMISLVKT